MCGKIGRNSREAILYIRQKRSLANFSRLRNSHFGEIGYRLTHHSPTFAGRAAQKEIRYLGLLKHKNCKNLFDYGDRLIHTIEVLGKYDRSDDKNEAYPRITEKAGDPPPQYDFREE